jgi:hypothetical protein
MVANVRSIERILNPALHVGDLGERVPKRFFDRRELSEANAKAHVIDIMINDDILGCRRNRGVDKKF